MNELQEKLESYLSGRLSAGVKVENMKSLSGGACQDNYLVDISVLGGSEGGNYKLVFRKDKGASLLTSLTRIQEYQVIELAHQFGVKTPKPFWLEPNKDVLGSPFYFMERIAGKANGRYLVKDASLNLYRKKLPSDLAENLARIHSVKPSDCKDVELLKTLGGDQLSDPKTVSIRAIQAIRLQVENLPEPHPAMELCLNWLESNLADCDSPVLVHGDFRSGNFMVTPEGLTGILDWEFAHFGDRHEDIAWLCMRDWRFGKLNKEAGGFASRKDFYSEYEKFSNIKVDEKKVLFWEVMGNLRWGVGSVQQAERHISGKDKGIELAAIGRRTCELEYEMMSLIENAR